MATSIAEPMVRESLGRQVRSLSLASVLRDQLPQHVRQDAAVPERDELFRRVDPRRSPVNSIDCSVAVTARTVIGAAGLQALGDAGQLVALAAR